MLLGDVVISTEVVRFDFGSRYSDSFVQKDTNKNECGRPNKEIHAFLHQIRGKASLRRLTSNTARFIEELCDKEDFQDTQYPGPEYGELCEKGYRHKHRDPHVCSSAHQSTCEQLGCERARLVIRSRLEEIKVNRLGGTSPAAKRLRMHEPAVAHIPYIHFGAIASGRLGDEIGYTS